MKVEENFRQLNIKQIQPNNNGGIKLRQPVLQNRPSFTGIPDEVLRFLNTNQAWGANAVDFFCMVLPRTLTDFTRGIDAGTETMRRESMGTINDSSVGLYGTVAGMALAMGINKFYNFGKHEINASSIFADSETLDLQGKIWNESLKTGTPVRDFVRKTLKSYEALSPNEDGKWVRFKDEDIEKAAEILEQEITTPGKKMSKDAVKNLKNTLISSIGVENNLRIIVQEGEKQHSSRYSIDSILENTYKLGKVFTKDKVIDAFKNSANIAENTFLKAMKSMNVKRSLIGIAVASLVGVSTQPINMYLTKKKTGQTKFVGGGEEDKSTKFKIKKGFVGTLFGAGVLATIGHPKNLVKNLQFKGFTPTIKQFKFIYGITILSRFLAARNDNELREATIKDTLGFASWLILGNFIQKLVAQKFDKTLLKRDGKGIMNWIQNSALKTRDEVLHAALGDKVFKDGKALSFKEMLKALPANSPAKKQLRILTIAQLAGYAYSALALGIGIPRLNIFITNRVEAHKKAKATAKADPTQTQPQSQTDNMLKPENIAFLNTKNFTGKNILGK